MEQDLSPEAVRKRRRIRGFLIFFVLLFLVTSGALILSGQFGVREWRARQLADKALDQLEDGKVAEAQRTAIAAYRLAPGEMEALRAVARVSAEVAHPDTAEFFRKLIESGKAEAKDHALYSRAVLRNGTFLLADEHLRIAETMAPETMDVILARAEYYAAMQNWESLEASLRKAESMDANNPSLKFRLGALQAGSPNEQMRQAGIQRIREVSKDKDLVGMTALGWLARSSQVNADEREAAIAAWRSNPLADDDSKLAAVAAEIDLNPGEKDNILDSLILSWREKPPEGQVKLGAWLAGHREYERALDLIPLKSARGRKDFFLVWLDASSGLGRWDEVRHAIESSPEVPLEPSLISLYRGRVALEEGDADRAGKLFDKSIAEASRNSEILWYLAGYFRLLGQPGRSEAALRQLTLDPGMARPAYGALIQLREAQSDTLALLGVIEEMALLWPGEIAVRNDGIYLRALVGKTREKDLEDVKNLLHSAPEKMPQRTALALLLLQADKPAEALEVYQGSPVPLGSLLPGQQAVFAAVLLANGMTDGARNVASGIPRDRLRIEELKLIEPLH